jgi:hypothetical protein
VREKMVRGFSAQHFEPATEKSGAFPKTPRSVHREYSYWEMLSPLEDAELDIAYSIFDEWGPDRRIPRKERLSRTYPKLTSNQIEALLGQLAEVHGTVWNIAKSGAEPKLGRDRVIELLQTRHPFLRGAGLKHAIFLANYYAWHEGYAR